ncbi:Aste57867_1900 [Aphanomyces stellatus]|uniref:Aste57867_1900 protein n=1 Tax=Aphanomyces stellatus TaxID=120398 RepID=A0A485K7J1_9STRA|nr:hypothetical protein As57867_001898 [Aphanomyces stellatus]VFT79107.1 Aste57867_1900 [Aphanomyces stellatus]
MAATGVLLSTNVHLRSEKVEGLVTDIIATGSIVVCQHRHFQSCSAPPSPMPSLASVCVFLVLSFVKAAPTIPMATSDRVVIVGGGPAGCHFASLLAKKGFTDIHLVETNNQVGGKSHTEYDQRGRPQEMGTVFALETYTPIFDLIKTYDPTNTRFAFSFEKPNYMYVMGESVGASDDASDVALDFPNYILQSIQRNAPATTAQSPPTDAQLQAIFVDQAKRYMALHRKLLGTYAYGLPPQPKDWRSIDMTAMEFLRANNLTALEGLFRFTQQQQGYGVLERIPAFYLLWWSHPEAIANIMRAQVTKSPSAYEFINGYQSLWIAMVGAHRRVINKIVGATVTRVSRGLGSAAKLKRPASVTYTSWKGETITIDCDHVVMAVDLSLFADLVVDMTSDEAALFKGTYVASTFTTTMFESDSGPLETAAQVWPLRMVNEDGRLSALRNSKLTILPGDPAAGWGNLTNGLQVRVAYQFFDKPLRDVDRIKMKSSLWLDLRKAGLPSPSVWGTFSFNYFPRFNATGLKKGLPWKIWDIQGDRRTTWIGSSVCFESVLDVVTYNNNLIQRVQVTGDTNATRG